MLFLFCHNGLSKTTQETIPKPCQPGGDILELAAEHGAMNDEPGLRPKGTSGLGDLSLGVQGLGNRV